MDIDEETSDYYRTPSELRRRQEQYSAIVQSIFQAADCDTSDIGLAIADGLAKYRDVFDEAVGNVIGVLTSTCKKK